MCFASPVCDTLLIMCRRILSDPELEGNPLDFLKQTEAYWKVSTALPHTATQKPTKPHHNTGPRKQAGGTCMSHWKLCSPVTILCKKDCFVLSGSPACTCQTKPLLWCELQVASCSSTSLAACIARHLEPCAFAFEGQPIPFVFFCLPAYFDPTEICTAVWLCAAAAAACNRP